MPKYAARIFYFFLEMNLLLSQAWETYESDKRIEGFSPQTLKAYKL